MRLKEFLTLENFDDAAGELDQEITGLTYDSRRAAPGKVFFAIPGTTQDGHDFVADAVQRGAAAVVGEKKIARSDAGTWVQVRDVRRTMGVWGAHFFGQPSRSMRIIGVTGTNGKTTVSYLVEAILAAAGLEPGVIGTVNYRYRGRQLPSHHTTPESLDLHELLAAMKSSGVDSAALEVSSHALVQDRVRGIDFDVGVFTNLSHDHLDYHKDMDDYFVAKARLFTEYLKISPKQKKAAVIHAGDRRGRELLKRVAELGVESWSYGRDGDWDVRPVKVQSDINGLSGTIQARHATIEFSSALIGTANLENVLGAIGVGFALGLPESAVRNGVASLQSVPGRLEKVSNNRGMTILVDYAHTPDALEKALRVLRDLIPDVKSRVSRPEFRVGEFRPETRDPRLETRNPKLICVFGCGGDRDRSKRPLMGEIAGRLSDLVFVTSDNPRTEDPLKILADIEAGVQKTARRLRVSGFESRVSQPKTQDEERETRDPQLETGYYVEPDRRLAIRSALRHARPGDVVLIAGKGHEDYQILGTKKVHFDDREVAREELSLLAEACRV
jgi:UDP-N-acetylmuramoyl-L-alanyl-D-glutamate--2,6-diaminopimelate ligase